MPSPFPGMAPYLEDPSGWMGFRNAMTVEMMAALNRLLMPAYYADIEERVYISDESDPGRKVIVPDARILPSGKKGKPKPGRGAASGRPGSRCANRWRSPPSSTTRSTSRT